MQVTIGVPSGMKVIEGHIDVVEDFMFIIEVMTIECQATSQDMTTVKKKEMKLHKISQQAAI